MNSRPPDDDLSQDNPHDPIAAIWATQEGEHDMELTTDFSELAISVGKAHRDEQLRLLRLNLREFLPPLLLGGLCGLNVSDSARPAATVFAAVLAALVSCFLLASSINHHREDQQWGLTIRDQLGQRSAQLKHRVWMYRNLGWWYFAPLATALALFIYGVGDVPLGEALFIYGIMVAILAVVVWAGRRSGRKRYDDESDRIETLLEEFHRTA